MVDINILRSLSAKHGLPLQFVIKEFYLMDLLGKLTSILEKESIIFKGGTALNRCYATGLSRFSEDLDFDYISKKSKKSKIKKLEIVKTIDGYRIEGPFFFKDRIRFDCFFKNEIGKKDVVRTEFNIRYSETIGTTNKTAISEISGTRVIGIKTYNLEGLIAQKLLALNNRTEGKDIFDLYNFIEKMDKNLAIKSLENLLRVENSKKSAQDVINNCIYKLESLRIDEVKKTTNNYIPVKLRPEWNQLVKTLKMHLESLTIKN